MLILMLVILMLTLILLYLNTDYADTDADAFIGVVVLFSLFLKLFSSYFLYKHHKNVPYLLQVYFKGA